MSIDRYVAIRSLPGSFYSKLPFGTPKSALRWSIGIVSFFAILNSHILIFNGYYEDPVLKNRTVLTVAENGTLSNLTEEYLYQNPDLFCNLYKNGFTLFPTWDQLNMFIYSFIPATVMITFNFLLIYTTLMVRKPTSSNSRNQESDRALAKKRKLTISILVITFAFIFLTLPSMIAWGFLADWMYATLPWGNLTLDILDYLSFSNHSSVFFSCFLTNYKFRGVIMGYFRRR
jgi:hypothetical protein